jgi:hypothetical protein
MKGSCPVPTPLPSVGGGGTCKGAVGESVEHATNVASTQTAVTISP